MARRSKNGKIIFSASEIGAYTVCPESWRLTYLEKVESNTTESHTEGEKLHATWAEGQDEIVFLTRGIQTLILVTLGIIIIAEAL